jgi:hypothetical protein
MGAGLMSLTAVKTLLKSMTDSHGLAFSHPDSAAKMQASTRVKNEIFHAC